MTDSMAIDWVGHPRPRAVLLDLGGVVLQLNPLASFNYWAQAGGVPPEQLMSRWGLDDAYKLHEIGAMDFATYAAHLGGRFGIELGVDEWLAGWNALFVGPFPEVAALLPRVASSYDLCCFSNTNEAHRSAFSAAFPDVLHSFRRVYASSSIGRRKPDVSSFHWVTSAMRQAPADVLFVDDSFENIEGAREAGLMAVHARGAHDVVAVLNRLFDSTPR